MNKMQYLNKDTLNITADDINKFLEGKCARVAKSKLYNYGERVTPSDTRRKEERNEYLFVSSMRWQGRGDYGGFILFNPRTNKLISCTALRKLPN